MESDPFGEWKIADAEVNGISELAMTDIIARIQERRGNMMFRGRTTACSPKSPIFSR